MSCSQSDSQVDRRLPPDLVPDEIAMASGEWCTADRKEALEGFVDRRLDANDSPKLGLVRRDKKSIYPRHWADRLKIWP
jgi:hypothetical protein